MDADVIFLLAFNLDEAAGMKEETIKFTVCSWTCWIVRRKWKQSGRWSMGGIWLNL